MSFFKLFTPVSYWALILLWSFIFVFYIRRIIKSDLKSRLFRTLLIILSIDAFRTLFESVYFGFWYTSLMGMIPRGIHEFLIRPENVFVPKFINVIAAILVVAIVLRKWIPEEEAERRSEKEHIAKLEQEIENRIKAEEAKEQVIRDLNEALEKVNTLHGLLPICASCKKIRDDEGYWQQIEFYVENHSAAEFSHAICPDCIKKLYGDLSVGGENDIPST